MSALFVGRFQPFHLGHLDALKQIFQKEERVIIVIGSAEDDYVPENPFSAGERYQMIEAALLGEEIAGEKITHECFTIIPVRNIRHYSLWVSHLESLLPPFERVYTGSPVVRNLFKTTKRYKVFPLNMNLKISGAMIRKLMREGKEWEKFVPKKAVNLIKKFKGVERVREM